MATTAALHLVDETSLGGVEPEAWNRLVAGGDFYQSHAWLRGQEGAAGIEPLYVLAYDERTLVAALPTYHFADGKRAECRELFGRELEVLLAGPRTGYRNRLLLHPELRPRERREVGRRVIEHAGEVAERLGYDGLLFDYLTSDGLGAVAASAPAVATFRTAEAWISTDGGGLASYLASLPGSIRSQVRRERRRFAAAGWSVRRERLSASLDEAAVAFAETERKYGRPIESVAIAEFLRRQAPHVDEWSVAFACRDEQGRLVGYSLLFEWADTLFARMVGFDYERLRRSFEYFNLLFYLPLEHMGSRRLARLHLGIFGGWEAKARRGATFRPLWSCLVGRDGGDGLRWVRPEASRAFAAELKGLFPRAVDLSEWDRVG